MNDDLNTPNGYAEIFETVKKLNQALRQREIQWDQVGAQTAALEAMLEILGIRLPKVELSEDDKEVFAQWNAAKAEKDFAAADAKRAILIERGLM
jgi:cysteinyl-tRNA synthetase